MKKIFFLSVFMFSLFTANSFAESVYLKSSQCRAVKRLPTGKWEQTSLGVIPAKTVLRGQRAKTREIFLFRWNQDIYAVNSKCIVTLDKSPPPEALEESSDWTVYPFVSLLSWHERVTISASDGRSSLLYSSNFGVCPGIGAFRKTSSSFMWDGSVCLVYARSDLANGSTTTANDVIYSTKNSRAYGLKAEIDALWRFQKDRSSIGFGVPLFYRMSGWPKPSSTSYKIKPDPAFHYGLVATSSMDIKHVMFKPKFGYLLSTKGLIWALDIGYLF